MEGFQQAAAEQQDGNIRLSWHGENLVRRPSIVKYPPKSRKLTSPSICITLSAMRMRAPLRIQKYFDADKKLKKIFYRCMKVCAVDFLTNLHTHTRHRHRTIFHQYFSNCTAQTTINVMLFTSNHCAGFLCVVDFLTKIMYTIEYINKF